MTTISGAVDETRYEVAIANRMLAALGLASGPLASNGHASMRVPDAPDRFVVKGRGYAIDALERMRPEEMIVCDLDGHKVDGPPNASQCFEVQMHSGILKMFPEVNAVVHVHARFSVLMSVLGTPLVPMCQEGVLLVASPLPVYPHMKLILTEQEGIEVATALGDAKAILLQGHGIVVPGRTLEEAVINAMNLEEQAKMNWYATCALGPDHPSIGADRIDEWANRAPMSELPHFVDSMRGSQPRAGGVWQLYHDIVSKDL